MYKIFINDKAFIISQSDTDETLYHLLPRQHFVPGSMAELLRNSEERSFKGIVLLADGAKEVFNEFCSHFIAIEAAGGLVLNNHNEILLIKRLGKWDLPKGKIDPGEEKEDAAMREVEEECGIGKLSIIKKHLISYHTYKLNNHRFLKITYWYLMHTKDTRELVPQLEENITEAVWKTWSKLDIDTLDTYFSIKDILSGLKQ